VRRVRLQDALAAVGAAQQVRTTRVACVGEQRPLPGQGRRWGPAEAEGRFEAAEQAYQHSLALKVQQNDQAGQANTLGQLGGLSDDQGRLEEAVGFMQQAVDIFVRSGDRAKEGQGRNNLAITLLRLGRHDQARTELHRALDCKEPYGHAAEPWSAWEILEQLERATGHPEAAHTARQQAIATYLAYRRAGGGSQNPAVGILDHVALALTEHIADQTARGLTELLESDASPRVTALINILQASLQATPDPPVPTTPTLRPATLPNSASCSNHSASHPSRPTGSRPPTSWGLPYPPR